MRWHQHQPSDIISDQDIAKEVILDLANTSNVHVCVLHVCRCVPISSVYKVRLTPTKLSLLKRGQAPRSLVDPCSSSCAIRRTHLDTSTRPDILTVLSPPRAPLESLYRAQSVLFLSIWFATGLAAEMSTVSEALHLLTFI